MRTTRRRTARRPLARLLLASVATPALMVAGLVVTAMPAAAAACAKGSGVTVVVGSDVRCAPGGGKPAAAALSGTGHSLTRVDRQPGFVCRVNGTPNVPCANTPPADSYWGLFWSDGRSGRWVYASSGVDSLSVPAGGWVALVFQTSSSRKAPAVRPIGVAPPAATAPRAEGENGAVAPDGPTGPAAKGAKDPGKEAAAPTPTRTTDAARGSETGSGAPDDDTQQVSRTSETSALSWVAATIAVLMLLSMWGMLWRRRTAGNRGGLS